MASLPQGSNHDTSQNPGPRSTRLKERFKKVGATLQKINLAKLIDDMEKDQQLADQLEGVNKGISEETARKDLVREATERCKAEIENHLREFLQSYPEGTYEEWIQELHPENVHEGSLFQDITEVDLRFYVEDSDHRLLWNKLRPERMVQARTSKLKHGVNSVDLLDG